MKEQEPIYVTQPYLPPLEEFIPYLEQIWDSKILTNNGPFHKTFEQELRNYLNVDYISLFSSGTTALITSLQALRTTGEVITTPYSFVATSHSLLWNNLQPVFVDIDKDTCNIDPGKIEEAITPNTTAILAVHCYGTPCAVERIQDIADIYGLKVIYDAAHAFGVNYNRKSILQHGDLSILSFHATKVFTTFEGGAIICPNEKTKKRIDFLKNFGFANETTVTAPGINGKMQEFSAALGLVQLKHIDKSIRTRKKIENKYKKHLKAIKGIRVLNQKHDKNGNASYLPIFIEKTYPLKRDELYEELKRNGYFGRRYFYPLISNMPMYRALSSAQKNNLINANKAAESVICLPIYPELNNTDIDNIISIIKRKEKR